MKLRYTGSVKATFAYPSVGEVEPGQEFIVPDEDAEGFLVRSDIEQVERKAPVAPTKPVRAKKEPEPEAPEVTETNVD